MYFQCNLSSRNVRFRGYACRLGVWNIALKNKSNVVVRRVSVVGLGWSPDHGWVTGPVMVQAYLCSSPLKASMIMTAVAAWGGSKT